MTRRIGRLRQRCALLGTVGSGSVNNVSRRRCLRHQGQTPIRFSLFSLLSNSRIQVVLRTDVQPHAVPQSKEMVRETWQEVALEDQSIVPSVANCLRGALQVPLHVPFDNPCGRYRRNSLL